MQPEPIEDNVCGVCGLSHEDVRNMCRKSLFVAARVLCNFKDMTPEFHGKMSAWVESNIRSDKRKMLILAPRGHLKSSLISIAGSIWMVINNPEVRILIVQASSQKVTELMQSIKGIVTGDSFGHYFPELVPEKGRFSDIAVELPRKGVYSEPTISARGINSTIVGGHYNVHILDDIIDENIASSEVDMDRVRRWFKNSPPLFVTPREGIRLMVGTRWAMNDVYQTVKNMGTHAVWEIGCYGDDRSDGIGLDVKHGEPVWPERFDSIALEGQRRDISDDVVWSFQYLNVPVVEGLRRFTNDHIQYFNWREYGKTLVADNRLYSISDMDVRLCVDPALGETAESDLFAITVCGWHRNSAFAFILDIFQGRIDPRQQVEKIIELAKKWHPRSVGIEQAGYQYALKTFLTERMRQLDTWFYVEGLKHAGVRKSKRIEALQPYFANSQVFLQRSHGELIKQLLGFQPKPDGSTGLQHDDLIDSLAYHPVFWKGTTLRNKPSYADEDIDDWTDAKKARIKKGEPAYGLRCLT